MLSVSACTTPFDNLETSKLSDNVAYESYNFCSQVSEDEAIKTCEAWRSETKSDLGERLNTSLCQSQSSTESTQAGCKFLVIGRISFLVHLNPKNP